MNPWLEIPLKDYEAHMSMGSFLHTGLLLLAPDHGNIFQPRSLHSISFPQSDRGCLLEGVSCQLAERSLDHL